MEGDASSASYFLAGAAVTGGTVTVEGCGTSSLQVCRPILRFCHVDSTFNYVYHINYDSLYFMGRNVAGYIIRGLLLYLKCA